MKKKVLAVLLGIILICTNVISTQAEASSKDSKTNKDSYESLPSLKNINKSIKDQSNNNKISKPEASYSSTSDYPLKTDGDYVGSLWDSWGEFQDVYFKEITDVDSNTMQISLVDYCDEAYYKDRYFNVEFLKDNGNGSTVFLDNSLGDFYGYKGVTYTVNFPKSWYEGQEFIYIFVGVFPSIYSTNYSDYCGFKVKNPFYTGGGSATNNGYAVVSNESESVDVTENTGTFSINNDKYSFNKALNRDAYKMDVNIPFDGKANRDKLLSNQHKSIIKEYAIGDSKSFYVADMTDDSTYQISATLQYTGSHANVWVNDNQITQADAERLGKEFDSNIYPKVTSNFGEESDVDGDGKLEILCYDIKDGFSGSGGYIAGYFYSGDLYNVAYSNKCEMFYIDTYPAMWTPTNPKDVSNSYSTLAHEFQHMVNYNQSAFVEDGDPMDVWLNEGMSMAAEQIYEGKALTDRIDYYNSSNSIKNGHSMLYWDYSGDTLSNYSLSYLFLQYFKLQAGQGDAIFKELQQLGNNNYKDIEILIKKYINPNMSFGQFMTNFRIALLLKKNSGLRGFKGDAGFSGISTPMYTGTGTSLKGGGGVAKAIDTTKFQVPTNKGADITYTIISKEANTPPTINGVSDKTIKIGDTFDPKNGITATDPEDGDITNLIQVNGTVNTKIAGSYILTYSVTDSDGNKVTNPCTITVRTNDKPVITGATDKTILLGSSFDPKAGVSASDTEDGNITAGLTVVGSVNTSKVGVYSLTYTVKDSDGNTTSLVRKITVRSNTKPVITGATDKTIKIGDSFDPKAGVSASDAEDGNITSRITVSGSVNTAKTGLYSLIYKVKDNDGNITTTVRKITVRSNTKPLITGATDKTIKIGDSFDPKAGVSASDAEDGNITSRITVSGSVNTAKVGVYSLTYSVKDNDGNVISVVRKITVRTNSKPVINGASNKTITVGSKYYPLNGVTATDKEDGNLTAKIVVSNKVNTSKAGVYDVVYSVTDKDMNKVTVSIKVTVLNVFKTFTINSIDNTQTALTGVGLYGAKVQAYVNGKALGVSALVNSKGAFKLTIPKQKAGTKISIRMTKSGYATIEKSTNVLNTFTTLTASSITAKSTYVTGKGLKGATIQIYVDGKLIGKAVVASNGTYKVNIPKQKAGKKVNIKMTKSGYRDAQISATVKK